MLRATIEDIMTEHIVKIKADATINQAAHILLRFRINGLLVVDENDEDKVVGVISTTDLLRLLDMALSRKIHRKEGLDKMSKMPVMKIARTRVLRIQKKTKIEKLVALMDRKKMYTVPVYDGDKLVGVIGRHDILNAAFYADDH